MQCQSTLSSIKYVKLFQFLRTSHHQMLTSKINILSILVHVTVYVYLLANKNDRYLLFSVLLYSSMSVDNFY